ncbi:MAG: hypothetical protein WDN31_05900 [Hyphomicrobium sp.]
MTLALIHNWNDSDGDPQKIAAAYKDAAADVVGKVHKRLSEARS